MAYKKKLLPIGKKFGRLVTLAEAENTRNDNRRYVHVKCECGSKKIVRYDSLKCGQIRSCGCLKSENARNQIGLMVLKSARIRQRNNIEDNIGKKYNYLTILSGYRHPKQKCTWVKVQCDCGAVFNANLIRVKTGRVKSCGCFIRRNGVEFISEVDGERLLVYNMRHYKGYYRLGTLSKEHNGHRKLIHRHEAEKVLGKLGQSLSDSVIIHHIDRNPSNNRLSNLCLFKSNSKHRKYHALAERAMYQFLDDNNLLEQFYNSHPALKPITLEEMLK